MFPDIIKNSWDTENIRLELDTIRQQLDRLTVQVSLSEGEKKSYAEDRVRQSEEFMKEQRRQRKFKEK